MHKNGLSCQLAYSQSLCQAQTNKKYRTTERETAKKVCKLNTQNMQQKANIYCDAAAGGGMKFFSLFVTKLHTHTRCMTPHALHKFYNKRPPAKICMEINFPIEKFSRKNLFCVKLSPVAPISVAGFRLAHAKIDQHFARQNWNKSNYFPISCILLLYLLLLSSANCHNGMQYC